MTAFHSSPRMLGQKQDKFWLTVGLCALTAALIFLPFYLLDGGFFHYAGDFNSQQISFYRYMNGFLKGAGYPAGYGGVKSTFSWATDLGSGTMNACEMVSSRALVYGDHKTVSLLKAEPNGAPYGVQIFGEVPQIMGEAAAAIEEYDFDFLDINMGCPAPKIVSGGAGSKLMLDPDLCGRIVEQVVAHTSRPVTVKMRKGWDADHVTAVECAKACEQAGAALIAVHARTREQMYTPGIDPEIIARVKSAVHVPVLGNGDIHSAEDAVALVKETGCDGVMIARAALGDPWLFERVNAALEGTPAPKEPNLQARMNALRRQVEEMVEQKGEFVAMPQARAQTMHYMKGLKGAASLRRYCCELTHLEDIDRLIEAVFDQQRKAGLDPDDEREVPFP